MYRNSLLRRSMNFDSILFKNSQISLAVPAQRRTITAVSPICAQASEQAQRAPVAVEEEDEMERIESEVVIPVASASINPSSMRSCMDSTAPKDYSVYFTSLRNMFADEIKDWTEDDPRRAVLEDMVQSLAMNPSYPMEEKKRAMNMAIRFLVRGEKLDVQVNMPPLKKNKGEGNQYQTGQVN